MIPIPHTQLVEFLNWSSQYKPNSNFRTLNKGVLQEYALEYLTQYQQEKQKGVSVLQILQIYPRLYYQDDLRVEIKHLVGCQTCWEMIVNAPVSIDSVELHPFLLAFQKHLLNYEVPIYIHSFGEIAKENESIFLQNIRGYFQKYGDVLVSSFENFLNTIDPAIIESYTTFHKQQGKEPLRKDETQERNGEKENTNDGYTEPLSLQRELSSEAERITNSVLLLMEGGFYDRYIQQLDFIRALAKASIISKNLYQALEFLSWLHENHPSLDILANAPVAEIKDLAAEFCETFGYSNSVSFSKDVAKWLQGNAEPTIIQRLIDIGQLIKRKSGKSVDKVPPFERYKTISFHAVFLFLSAGDFPKFIKTYWEDLNFLTGDYIDVYYSDDDAERKISAFKTKNEFRSLRIQPMSLPAIILWQDTLKNACVISLERLSHDDIFDLVKLIVQKIQVGNSLSEIHQEAVKFVQRKTLDLQPAYQIYFSGDNIMGDKIDFSNSNITNNGGQMFLGKFQDVIANLNASGKGELAQAISSLKDAIQASKHLNDEQKQENVEALTTIADEVAKPKPNSFVLKSLSEGLIAALKVIPDVVKAVETLSPLLVPLFFSK